MLLQLEFSLCETQLLFTVAALTLYKQKPTEPMELRSRNGRKGQKRLTSSPLETVQVPEESSFETEYRIGLPTSVFAADTVLFSETPPQDRTIHLKVGMWLGFYPKVSPVQLEF